MSCWLTTVRRLDESYRPRVFFSHTNILWFLIGHPPVCYFFLVVTSEPWDAVPTSAPTSFAGITRIV